MKTQVQVRRYENLTQIDVDLRLIEAQTGKMIESVASINEPTQKACRKFIRSSEFASVAMSSIRNIKTWIDHANLPEEGPKNLPDKITEITKKLHKLEDRIQTVSSSLCKPSRELRTMAARLKVECDSYLTETFDRASSKAMMLANRTLGEFEPIIQIEYSKPVKDSGFQFPKYVIRVHERDGKLSVSTSCIGSLIASATPNHVANVESALIFLRARLVAQGLITPTGTKD